MFPFLFTLWMSRGSHFLFSLLSSDCRIRMKILASSVSVLGPVLLQLISLYIF